jgi:MATE family multidrug resistance protein
MKHLNQNIAKLAFPLILSNLTVPLLGITNTFLLGHMDHSYYLGALSLGEMIFNFLYWGFGFLRMGTTGLVAQSHGGVSKETGQIIYHSLLTAIVLGVLLLSFQLVIAHLTFAVIGGSETVRNYAEQYFYIRIWAAPAVLINYVLIGAYIGYQNSKAPLILMSVVNILAVILGVIFVFHLGLDVRGVALGDVIAQYIGTAVGFILLKSLVGKSEKNINWKLNYQLCKKLFSANRDIFIRNLCLIFAFAFFTIQGNKLGMTILAANTVLISFFTIMSYGLDGFSNAAEALVGNKMGKKDYAGMLRVVFDTGLWALLIAIVFTLIYTVAGKTMVNLMTSLSEVRITAYHYLGFATVLPLIAMWCFLFDGVFIGTNRFAAMRNTMFYALVIYLGAWYFTQSYGNLGLWFAFIVFFAVRGVSLGYIFWRDFIRKGAVLA